jgi:Fuc2NAc and GlcNAc transferase
MPASIPFLGADLRLGFLGYGIASIYIVWLINLTNFMDGIDGLAGVETVTVCLGGGLLWWMVKPGFGESLTPLLLASAMAGFLVWNWPPARIFMGDAGSGFLGLMFAGFSLAAARMAPPLLWSWLILLGVFVVDATATLISRLARREKFYQAHRTHAYQHAAQRCGAHRPVILVIAAINLGWLLPLALIVAVGRLDGFIGVMISYSPLVASAYWLRAGIP